MVKQLTTFLNFFLYVSNIQFIFLPEKIRTRLIISVIGLFYYIFKFGGSDVYNLGRIIKMILPLAIWMLLSVVLNMSSQLWFLQYVVLQIIFAVGAVFIIDYGKVYKFTHLLWAFVIYILIQNTIAYLSYQIPIITYWINTIQVAEISTERAALLDIRSFGIGEFGLFGGGALIAIGILATTVLYKLKEMKIYVYIPILLYVLYTGLFVARTSLTGLLALVLLLLPLRKNWKKAVLMLVLGWAFLTIVQRQERVLESQGYTTYYAFELFDNYSRSGKMESASFNSTIKMWQTIPTDFKTWFIGDAKYEDEKGGYYMQVDVGYLRVLFYGGLIGLFLYLYYIFKIEKNIYIASGKNHSVKNFLVIFFVLVLMWMWKGHFDTNFILYLFLFSAVLRRNMLIQKQNIIG